MGTSNLNIFNKGMAKAQKAIKKQLRTLWINIGRDLLYDAVQSWSGYNMTGNTANSYACAIYEDGKILHFFDAKDVGVEDNATTNYSYPGDYIYFWHQKSMFGDDNPNYTGVGVEAENNSMGVVKKYKKKKYEFQQVGRGSGKEDAKRFLNEHKAGKGLEICIVVGVPYAEYLENVRKLEVLHENFTEAKEIADANISTVKSLEIK